MANLEFGNSTIWISFLEIFYQHSRSKTELLLLKSELGAVKEVSRDPSIHPTLTTTRARIQGIEWQINVEVTFVGYLPARLDTGLSDDPVCSIARDFTGKIQNYM